LYLKSLLSPVLLSCLLVLSLGACQTIRDSPIEEVNSSQLDLPKDLPYNPLINKSAPMLRHDAFYDCKIKDGDKEIANSERFITNGKGFVAYSADPKFEGGYYLFNYSGHTSLLVDAREHTFKVAMSGPGDDIIKAYLRDRDRNSAPKESELGTKQIGKYECVGNSYKDGDTTIEEWFAQKPNLLVSQKITRPGYVLTRMLTRFNPYCETSLLRLPQGFTLIK